MSYFQDLQAALETRLAALSTDLEIAWENVRYAPTVGRSFMRPTVLMSPSTNLDLSGSIQADGGIFQIDVFMPTGNGAGAITAELDKLYDHFKAQLTLTQNDVKVYIDNISRSGPVSTEEAWARGTLEINFTCYE